MDTEIRDKDEHGHGSDPRGGSKPTAKDVKSAVNEWAQTDDKGQGFIQAQAKAEDAIREGKASSNPICVGIRSGELSGSSYRGQVVAATDPILGWEKGQDVQVMPSSFSGKLDVANEFASGDHFSNPATDNAIGKGIADPSYKDTNAQVILQISGEHNGINVDKMIGNYDPQSAPEHEHICGGRFSVASIKEEHSGSQRVVRIKLKQTGVF